MHPLQARRLIERKRDGGELSTSEVRDLVGGYVAGQVPEAQMAAFLMAVYFRGMSLAETTALTLAMASSGRQLDLSSIPGTKVDKHSTGGVGDKTTLVVVPLVAAAGAPVVKMSGRALGHTGGTIDKLEAIPGLRTDLSPAEMLRQVKRTGLVIAAQSRGLVPADKRIYALRDLTGTVVSIPLIAASVMSKKLAAGADAILLDVKLGRGAFMRTEREARALARTMVEIGKRAGRKVVALLTRMDQPLGRAIGDALEVQEAIATLRGDGPRDLTSLCLTLASEMLVLAGKAGSKREAVTVLEGLISSGAALERFRRLVGAQGGDPAVAERPEEVLGIGRGKALVAAGSGFVTRIDARALGEVAHELALLPGGGRDHGAGLLLAAKQGERVRARQPLVVIHCKRGRLTGEMARRLRAAFTLGSPPPPGERLIAATIG
jgi:pyrimidine-nucleoside phosphorylase